MKRNSRQSCSKKYTPKTYKKTPKSADCRMTPADQEKLTKLGLVGDWEMNEKTSGYFKSQEIDDLVNKLI